MGGVFTAVTALIAYSVYESVMVPEIYYQAGKKLHLSLPVFFLVIFLLFQILAKLPAHGQVDGSSAISTITSLSPFA
ncbi:hypothetical protein [Bartonella sp. MM55XZML]|uniref:hypothetical protein n=1 Tax=Bartonella sp. MM55XZML TaxID=3243552 RepID=UPI0035CF1BF8